MSKCQVPKRNTMIVYANIWLCNYTQKSKSTVSCCGHPIKAVFILVSQRIGAAQSIKLETSDPERPKMQPSPETASMEHPCGSLCVCEFTLEGWRSWVLLSTGNKEHQLCFLRKAQFPYVACFLIFYLHSFQALGYLMVLPTARANILLPTAISNSNCV